MTEKTLDDLIPDDFLMQIAWQDCLHWAVGEPRIMDQFTAQTGLKFSPPKNLFEKLIDEACGNDGFAVTRAFIIWFNANVWGDIHLKAGSP